MTTNYPTFFSQFFNSVGASSSAADWNTEFPLVIDRAEQRLYRDLDLLGVRVTDQSASTTVLTRVFPLPVSIGTFLIIESVNLITPGTSQGGAVATGTRNQLVPYSRPYIDLVYPSQISSNAGTPVGFAMQDNANIILGPCPDSAYPMEIVGTQRPSPLSSANSSTILTQLLPDLWFAAAMTEAGTYMRYTEPQVGMSWQAEYDKLLKSALQEELRKKFQSQGWTSLQPSPLSSPRSP